MEGKPVTILRITMAPAEPALKRDSVYAKYRDRAFALAWADSTVGAALVERGPEVQWILPPELPRLAHRSPGMGKDPDTYGQAIRRPSRYKELPEPPPAHPPTLIALARRRIALI